ncbi:hypothetical protein MMC14_004037 [Varicellaria rhodocarpa]|nr:hypothetical protein [Varicellaria rhodocarpa]
MSPVSPTSSSDLYSASEPDDQLMSSVSKVVGQKSVTRECGLRFQDEKFGSSRQQSPTGMRLNMSSSYAYPMKDVKVSTNGTGKAPPNGPQKRKREEEPELMAALSRRPKLDQAETSPDSMSTDTIGRSPGQIQGWSASAVLSPRDIQGSSNNSRLFGSGHEYHSSSNSDTLCRKKSMSAEIWQHIFCFIPPVFLGRLLRVNHYFHDLLTPNETFEETNVPNINTVLKNLDPDSIWAASRKRFCPGLPKPLHGINELDMWRLLRGNDCQICGTKSSLLTSHEAANPLECGPGKNGVRVVWPFGEVTLLFSSSFPSFLFPAMSYAFISQSDQYVASISLRNMAPPSDLAKHFYKPHIEDIKRRLYHAQDLGPGSAEEWIKGLDTVGKERTSDAARWELWESKGGLKKVNAKPPPRIAAQASKQATNTSNHDLGRTANFAREAQGQELSVTNMEGVSGVGILGILPPAPPLPGNFIFTLLDQTRSPNRFLVLPSASNLSLPASQDGLPQRPPGSLHQLRPERSIRDVNETKAARRADIERRCLALDPPLGQTVLQHMESFQAAIQISTPLTDHAWDVLKPRLLAQQEVAERREEERVQQGKLLQAKSEERRQQEAQLKEAKETMDKEWDLAQTPVRHKLALYADDIIKESWSDGKSVTKDTCPKFAADVLLYTRRRFYDDLIREDTIRRSNGEEVVHDAPNGPPTRKLILENMKWLFDNKVKAFTENFQKELFLCNGCDGNFKLYGFEGVIQHYAAKHTTTLSLGSIVVHWRSEWPEHSPFHPDPSAAKAAYYAAPVPASNTMHSQHSRAPQAPSLYGGYSHGTIIPGHRGIAQSYPTSQFPPDPYHPQYPTEYHHSPYSTPSATVHPSGQQDYPGHPVLYPPNNQHPSFTTPDVPTIHSNGYNGYPGHYANPPYQHNPPYVSHPYPNMVQYPRPGEGYPPYAAGSGYMQPHPPTLQPKPLPPYTNHTNINPTFPGQVSELYQAQMNEMAKHARDVWNGTSGIKEIPQSVRIFVVIHHVCARYAEKHTNEPSLTMFLDGLNHSALMRPVRSLNGLACRTCVANSNSSSLALAIVPQVAISDRKLYTLPHLLNHFKNVHLERADTTGTNQTESESSHFDWKRDMVELPETPLIAELVNASGMDDAKLQIIAWAFPDVFPSPLPKYGAKGNTGSLPKQKGRGKNQINYRRESPVEVSRVDPYYLDDRSDEAPQSRPYSALRQMSPSTARTSEPPGEDEYDPHRPAYLGRMVESHTINAPARKATKQSPLRSEHRSLDPLQSEARTTAPGIVAKPDRYVAGAHYVHEGSAIKANSDASAGRIRLGVETQAEDKNYTEHDGHTYGEINGRGRSRSRRPELSGIVSQDDVPDTYVSEDGEVNEEARPTNSERRSRSPVAERTAAEIFLNEFNPEVESEKYAPDYGKDRHGKENRFKRDDLEGLYPKRRPAYRDDTVEILPRRSDDKKNETSYATPTRNGLWEVNGADYVRPSQSRNGYVQPASQYQPTPRIEFVGTRTPLERQSGTAFEPYNQSQHNVPHDTAEADFHIRPRSRYPDTQQSNRSHHRDRTRSPPPISLQPANYRARSPPEDPRPEKVFHMSSPVMQRDHRQGPVYYEFEPNQDEYAYVRDPAYPDGTPRRCVEYVPIGPEEYGPDQPHYVLAQAAEYRESSDRVRLVRGYPGEQVYRPDHQVYYAGSRMHESRPSKPILPVHPEYDDYRRHLV